MDYLTLEKPKMGYQFADELMNVAVQELQDSTENKRGRMGRIKEFEDLYAGKVRPRLRIQYDCQMPVFSGFVDTLESAFDDPVYLKFKYGEPADYFNVRRIQAMWEKESKSNVPTALWPLKSRWDKHLAILSGRGHLKFYAESDPEYKSVLDVVDYKDVHTEPLGGGHLENHLYCGMEGVYRTKEHLISGAKNGAYNMRQLSMLLSRARNQVYRDTMTSEYAHSMNRFTAMGFDPQANNYVGQEIFNLVEWFMTYKGERWYLLFDPFTKIWLRAEKLTDIHSSGYYPIVSWATHEDPKVYWSKAYCDDFYPASQTIVDLVNQEVTNRWKKMSGGKLYDPSMIVDVQELDEALYSPDQLVEVDTKSGAREIGKAVFEIPVGELGSATIDLVNWLESNVGRQTGSMEMIAQGNPQGKGKQANVFFAQLQAAQKRIGHKAHSYVEAWSQIGTRYVEGLRDHFKGSESIEVLGPQGYEPDIFTRGHMKTKRSIGILVSSQTEQDQENVFGKNQKMQAMTLLANSPNINSKWRDARILRDVGGFSEEDIAEAMDTQNFMDKETLAGASVAINALSKGKLPPMNYSATMMFAMKIFDFARDHKMTLGPEKYTLFLQYLKAHATIIAENMARLGQDIKAGRQPAPGKGSTAAGDNKAPAQKENPRGKPAAARAPLTPLVRGAAGPGNSMATGGQ